jgi:mannan endo-1,4-beta-mannosidase
MRRNIFTTEVIRSKIRTRIGSIAIVLIFFTNYAAAQVNANANTKTKFLFENLKKIQNGNSFLFGQEFFNSFKFSSGSAHGDETFSDAKDITGSHPALLGSDFHYYLEKDVTERGYHTDAVKWAFQQGYVITFDWHISARGTNSYSFSGSPANLANNIVNDLNGDRTWYFGELDKIIKIMNEDLVVGNDTIPIVFRPWHEMNGNWFWWGSSAITAANYKLLYALTVNYVKERTTSVLFAWTPNTPVDFNYYPGDDYVDVLGVDIYEATATTLRAQLGSIVDYAQAHNKIAVLSETGNRVTTDNASLYWKNTVLPAILDDPTGKAKKIAWVLTWINASWSNPYVPHSGTGTTAKQSFIDFKNSSSVLFGDEIPDMYSFIPEIVSVDDEVSSSSPDLKVFPIPSSNMITVNVKGFKKPRQITIYDAVGRLVYKTEVNIDEVTFSTKEILKSGSYILKVTDQKDSVMRKLMVN